MNCQDISRALESRDVNALSAAERRACDAHAASCSHCGPGWIVYTRLAAIPAPLMPQQLAMQCEALAAAKLGGISVRRSSRTVLLGTIIALAAAAAVLVTRMSPSPRVAALRSAPTDVSVPGETPAATNPGLHAAETAAVPGAVAVQPVTVQLLLVQATDDPGGRDFGQQVYEHAQVELRALAGVVLVNVSAAGVATPAFRITYTNRTISGGSFQLGQDGIPSATPATGDQPLLFNLFLEFKVEAFRAGANGTGAYEIVFRRGAAAFMSPACFVQPVADGCNGSTPPDIATWHVLSWRLETSPPDNLVEEKLHAMLRNSSLRPMAFEMLDKYGMLRTEDLRQAVDLIVADTKNPVLRSERLRALIKAGNGPDVMREVQDLLLRVLPNGDRPAGMGLRMDLVRLLAADLRNESATQATLESVAATDPHFDVRVAAKRALGQEVEAN